MDCARNGQASHIVVELTHFNVLAGRSQAMRACFGVHRESTENSVDMRLRITAFSSPWCDVVDDVFTKISIPNLQPHLVAKAEQDEGARSSISVAFSKLRSISQQFHIKWVN